MQSQLANAIVLYGADSSYFAVVLETLNLKTVEVIGGIVCDEPGAMMSGLSTVITEDEVGVQLSSHQVFVVRVAPGRRAELVAAAQEKGFAAFPTILDPRALVPEGLDSGKGCYVGAGADIGPAVQVGDFVYVGRQSVIGHHTVIDDYVTIAPAAAIASNCRIGQGAMIGIGATLAPGAQVGANAVVGAGAVVVKDVPANVTVAGNPAKIIKEHEQAPLEG